jgi:hypothetical protein
MTDWASIWPCINQRSETSMRNYSPVVSQAVAHPCSSKAMYPDTARNRYYTAVRKETRSHGPSESKLSLPRPFTTNVKTERLSNTQETVQFLTNSYLRAYYETKFCVGSPHRSSYVVQFNSRASSNGTRELERELGIKQ